jgi:hypothetical protein
LSPNSQVLLRKGILGDHPIFFRKKKLHNHLIFIGIQKQNFETLFFISLFLYFTFFLNIIDHEMNIWLCLIFFENFLKTWNYAKDTKGFYLFQCRLSTR